MVRTLYNFDTAISRRIVPLVNRKSLPLTIRLVRVSGTQQVAKPQIVEQLVQM